MSKKVFNLIVFSIIIVGVAAGVFIWKELTARPSFSQISVEKGDIKETINFPGTVKSRDEADLSFEINGKIEKIYHHTGDTVDKNDILAVLSSDDLRAQYNQSVDLAKSAEGLLENYKELQDKEKYKLEALKKTNAAKNDKKAQEEQVDAQKELVSSQEDQVRAAWDNAASKKAQLEKTTIRANFSGRIAKENFNEGEVVVAGTPVLTLINDQAFEIELFSSELDITKIKVGQSGEAKALKNQDKSYLVRVVKIDLAETKYEGVPSYKIIFEVINDDGSLRSGMETRIDLEMANKNNVLVISKDSIFQDKNEKYVYVDSGGKQEKRMVETGIYSNDNKVEIISGLSEGEKISVLNDK
jgi:RND family efflux transporter MFP subunit